MEAPGAPENIAISYSLIQLHLMGNNGRMVLKHKIEFWHNSQKCNKNCSEVTQCCTLTCANLLTAVLNKIIVFVTLMYFFTLLVFFCDLPESEIIIFYFESSYM